MGARARRDVGLAVAAGGAAGGGFGGAGGGARARRVSDRAEIAKVGELMLKRFPEGADFGPDEADSIAIFSISPVVISLLDYRHGIGHTQLVTF